MSTERTQHHRLEDLDFGIDGDQYTITLLRSDAQALRQIFAPYLEHAHLTSGLVRSTPDSRRIRRWAIEQGYLERSTGRLPASIVAMYEDYQAQNLEDSERPAPRLTESRPNALDTSDGSLPYPEQNTAVILLDSTAWWRTKTSASSRAALNRLIHPMNQPTICMSPISALEVAAQAHSSKDHLALSNEVKVLSNCPVNPDIATTLSVQSAASRQRGGRYTSSEAIMVTATALANDALLIHSSDSISVLGDSIDQLRHWRLI